MGYKLKPSLLRAAVFAGSLIILLPMLTLGVRAAEPKNGFSLQVTPSPIIATLKPGEKKAIELRIRNTNSEPENLKMGLRSFNLDSTTGDVNIEESQPSDVANWVTFQQPLFTVDAGQWFTQIININTPLDAGFAYSFAVTISRQTSAAPAEGQASIEGTVAVFTLLNIDKPDAQRKLEINSFTSDKRFYEYLPVTFTTKLNNTGNTLLQPRGNIYIGRTANSSNPITVMTLNKSGGYMLPNSVRSFTNQWVDGFPVHTIDQTTSKPTSKLNWDWAKLSNFRFGRYVAHEVVVYDDGVRDVPVESNVAFWIFPWKLMLGALAVISIMVFGIYSIIRSIVKAIAKRREKSTKV